MRTFDVPESEWRSIWRTDFQVADPLPGFPVPRYVQRHLYWDRHWRFRRGHLPHADNWQFTWTISGLVEFQRGSAIHHAPPGTGFLYRLADQDFTMQVPEGRRDPWVFLHFSFAGADLAAAGIHQRLGPVITVPEQHILITSILRHRHDLRSRQPLTRLDGAQMVLSFLDRLDDLARPRRAAGEDLVQRAERVLWQRCNDGLNVDQLAQACGVSPEHLGRTWRARRGTTPHHAILAERLRRAAQALTESQLTVAAVASQCGFASPSHFARVYRRHFGQQPRVSRSPIARPVRPA